VGGIYTFVHSYSSLAHRLKSSPPEIMAPKCVRKLISLITAHAFYVSPGRFERKKGTSIAAAWDASLKSLCAFALAMRLFMIILQVFYETLTPES
jgi:hypothetical protein